jgi:GrpB-like predicted nucleotidyltransferase (UPF0157 family)/ribosomal protein S18 acetylase RimI-like enzyme
MERSGRDAELDQALIGGREKRTIFIADYDPSWPSRFERERERVRAALGDRAVRIEHIGSTAVPGLAAKPIVDLLVTVEDPEDDAVLVPALQSAGFELRVREPGHRMFRTPGQDVHVHIWASRSSEVARYLAFRDQLRRSLEDREAYERLKRELATRDWADMNDYADAKGELIEAILARAPFNPDTTAEEAFRRWYLPWKPRVCDAVRPFSHGTVCRSGRLPDYWEYNCLRLDLAMEAEEMIAAADRELADCAHRFVEWLIPMPDHVVAALRGHGWIANPLIFMLHDGGSPPEQAAELVEVDYDAVRELRDIWHREDFGDHVEPDSFHDQARKVAELASVHVVAAIEDGRPSGFAQVETHDGGSEVTQVFVRPECRGRGLGRALTEAGIRVGAEAAPQVWICAERDNRPRRLYERLGFRPVVETGVAILPPSS